MAAGWTWPLVISVLRLVFISTLSVVNWTALYRVISTKKYKTGRRRERLLVTTIIVVSLVYLTVVWVPFTFTALKHDLKDLQQNHDLKVDLENPAPLFEVQNLENDIVINNVRREKEDEVIVEYIDLVPNVDSFQDDIDAMDSRLSLENFDLVSEDKNFDLVSEDKNFDLLSEDKNFDLVSEDENFDLISKDKDRATSDETNEEFTLEYIDIRTGKTVKKESPLARIPRSAPEKLEAAWTVFFHTQPHFQSDAQDDGLQQESGLRLKHKNEERASNSLAWNSDVQDLVTSSCAYSLAFTAIVRATVMRRFMLFPDSPWVLGIWSGLAVGIPGAITLLVRSLGGATTHFAPHQPEYTATGYFLYNIICDVHISEEYVVSVFLEWAALFTFLLIGLAVFWAIATKTHQGEDLADNTYGPLHQDEGNSSNIETWARDLVLMVGAIWSWPIKPLVVLILFCLYGSHWTNLVCWISHVVVAIPVVFIPLAVFLSRSHFEKSSTDIYVIDEDPKLSQKTNKHKDERGEKLRSDDLSDVEKVQNITNDNINFNGERGVLHDGVYKEGHKDEDGRGHAKENLKFYLGKDIFKNGLKPSPKKEDKQIILENEWGDLSISEA